MDKELEIFIDAFVKRLKVTPYEFIVNKINTGSQIDAIAYLFNITAARISSVNNCKYFDFDYFYNP